MAGGEEAGAQAARSRALAVLRVRSRALAVALLPAAVAVVLLAGGATGHLTGPGWSMASWIMSGIAVVVLLAAVGIALVVARARPAVSPTVSITEQAAPDLYRLVRDLADRLDVPPPSAIALTPDCDSWLEDRTHPSHSSPDPRSETAGSGSADSGTGAAGTDRADEMTDARGSAPGAPGAHSGPRSGLPSGLQSGPRSGAPSGMEPGFAASRRHRPPTAPVLVIGSPFLWWMRVGELRAVLAPVVAGTGPSAHPDIAAARRFVRGLDAAVAVSSSPTHGPLVRSVLAGVGWVTRLLLRGCRGHAAEMERGVAAAAAERAQAVDYGLRIVAQEQVGLAYAGWDRLLTRVALPAWRMGRWPSRLDAGVVAALTELSRRDRLAEGFASRLGERPACDLLEEPGTVDEAASLLAARLFHGGPAESGADWSPVDWHEYPDEVVDRKWRTDAARLHRVLDTLGARHTPSDPTPDPTGPAPGGPTLSRVLNHLTTSTTLTTPAPTEAAAHERHHGSPADHEPHTTAPDEEPPAPPTATGHTADGDWSTEGPRTDRRYEHNLSQEPDRHHISHPGDGDGYRVRDGEGYRDGEGDRPSAAATPNANGDFDAGLRASDSVGIHIDIDIDPGLAEDDDEPGLANARSAGLAAALTAELAREEAAAPAAVSTAAGGVEAQGPDRALWDDGLLPLFPMQPPRTGRELLAEHVTAMVCCAAMDTAGAAPGLDWLDGPSLLVDGERAADLAPRVLTLVEDGDPAPLRDWLRRLGVRPEKPVRLV
ncbi:membrane protein [Streptomyces sp. FxanaA7]|uniref:membrane protein n=1 Tax=Streptomyces sp. FxanaA7 TaxID=1265492 RepID=UPI0005EFFEF6|nr:membrane protein [Streptomyces sp. FxanaA7]